jgi:hypothetical protein
MPFADSHSVRNWPCTCAVYHFAFVRIALTLKLSQIVCIRMALHIAAHRRTQSTDTRPGNMKLTSGSDDLSNDCATDMQASLWLSRLVTSYDCEQVLLTPRPAGNFHHPYNTHKPIYHRLGRFSGIATPAPSLRRAHHAYSIPPLLVAL